MPRAPKFGLVASVNTFISNVVPYHAFHDRIRPDPTRSANTKEKNRQSRTTCSYFCKKGIKKQK